MTAMSLTQEIFSRHQGGIASNIRRLSQRQFDALRSLFLEETENGTIHYGTGESIIWAPAGRDKYVLTEDRVRFKHTLTRFANLAASGAGSLFG